MNNHQPYSSSDIQRYISGQMTAAEMNALEKAALEDPFLSDAIEGYTVNSAKLKSGPKKDLEDLQGRLKYRLDKDQKVVTGYAFKWWKAAAVIILLAGAGALVYTLTNTNRQTETLAKNEATVPVPPPLQDTLDGNILSLNEPAAGVMDRNGDQIPAPTQTTARPFENKASVNKTAEGSQVKPSQKRPSGNHKPEPDLNKKDADHESVKEQMATVSVNQTAAPMAKEKAENIFSGKIVDENNRPVPLATVLVNNSQLGVSADTGGRFNFSFSDTVATVNVSSVGFVSAQATLKTGSTQSEITLQRNDRGSDAIIPISGRAKTAVATAKSITTTSSGVEPVAGWIEYHGYIAKNKKLPPGKEDIQEEVTLSFVIDTNGRPEKFIIEKPASPAVNAEAIRLLKEGPPWKTSQQTRAVVKIKL